MNIGILVESPISILRARRFMIEAECKTVILNRPTFMQAHDGTKYYFICPQMDLNIFKGLQLDQIFHEPEAYPSEEFLSSIKMDVPSTSYIPMEYRLSIIDFTEQGDICSMYEHGWNVSP
jgi:hypothetical protein